MLVSSTHRRFALAARRSAVCGGAKNGFWALNFLEAKIQNWLYTAAILPHDDLQLALSLENSQLLRSWA
jgi:hypothetical protein